MSLRAPKGYISESDPRVSLIGHPAPPWLINYADLMTELVCFFVIMYALAAALNKKLQSAAVQIQGMIKDGQLHGSVEIDKQGLQITLQEQGTAPFFGSGVADPTQEIDDVLAKLAPTLKSLSKENEIVIEGNTDDQTISNKYFDSNWELSTARATSVLRVLVDKYGLPPSHMSAIGYGQYRPIVPNDTPENRAKNRRVVILVKGITVGGGSSAQGPPAAAAH